MKNISCIEELNFVQRLQPATEGEVFLRLSLFNNYISDNTLPGSKATNNSVFYFAVYLKSSSQGLMPVCFLKAVEKWEMDEYPSESETSVTVNPFSYNKYFACSMRWL